MISLIHPSRGRPKKAYETLRKWWQNYTRGSHFEHILSLDSDDPKLRDYLLEFPDGFQVLINQNKSVVDATNAAAREASGDILIYLSDDFDCPDNWIQLVEAEFSKYSGPTLIKVDDCLQPFHVDVLTIPMMNRALYDKLGYFWHPGYRSMFCDVHLYWRTRKLGALQYAPHLKFEHKHVSVGKSDDDETYRRSAANWNQGKELFAKHKAAGFIV